MASKKVAKHLKKRWKLYAHVAGHSAGAGHAYLLGRKHADPFRDSNTQKLKTAFNELNEEVKKAMKEAKY